MGFDLASYCIVSQPECPSSRNPGAMIIVRGNRSAQGVDEEEQGPGIKRLERPSKAVGQRSVFLTPSKPIRIMKLLLADVAELADAQVSEACDGDIVEVQVLSSAPNYRC